MHHVTEASAHSAPERGNGAAKWAPVHCSKGVEGSGAGSVSRESEDQQPAHPLRSFWRLAGGFWGRGEPLISWLFCAVLLLIVLLALAASYGMNVWYRVIFDALQSRESNTVLSLSLLYLPLLAGSVLVSVTQLRMRMSIQRRWRTWLNHRLLDRWLCDGRCYQLDLVGGPHANPEGRIAEDARIATETPVELAIGLTTAVLSAATFIVVLWTVGGAVTVEIAGAAVTVPGFLVVAAAVYAALASGTMFLIGRRLIVASERKSQAEAEYRYGLTRLREDAEGIALLEGEHEERRGAERSFRAVVGAWRDVCLQSMRTTVVSQTSGYTAPILPIILCAPKFLDGALTLGEVMQAASAFVLVQSALNWMVDNYPRLAEWSPPPGALLHSTCRWPRSRARKPNAPAGSSAATTHTPRCGCATSRSCARTGWRSSQVPSSRSCRERSSYSPAPPALARARWCARSRARGPGAAAGSRFVPAPGYWCCRSALTSRPVRCVAS